MLDDIIKNTTFWCRLSVLRPFKSCKTTLKIICFFFVFYFMTTLHCQSNFCILKHFFILFFKTKLFIDSEFVCKKWIFFFTYVLLRNDVIKNTNFSQMQNHFENHLISFLLFFDDNVALPIEYFLF